jgi:hypothetical protein
VAILARKPTFLPLTLSAASALSNAVRTLASRTSIDAVCRSADDADAAAAECWAALLGGCDAPGSRILPRRLRELAEATKTFAGAQWWHGAGSEHRHRVGRAQQRIEEAITERDGADFAEAFVGYDQAVATALVRAHSRMERSAR